MKQFNYKKILIALFSITAFWSCDVNRYPELDISDDAFWKNENDIKLAANYLYTFVPGFDLDENWSDNSFGRSSNSISDGSRIAPSGSSGDYATPYLIIRAANKLLAESSNLNGIVVNEVALKQYQAEAHFFRAWAYFDLVQKYGNVQFTLKVLDDDSPELYEKQVDRSIVLDQIYADLDIAVANLPKFSAIPTADYGRIANTVALGLKSRVALFEGTRSKYHGYGDPAKHLTIARDAALEVINSGEHRLQFNLLTAFKPEAEGPSNTEAMMVKVYGVTYNNIVSRHSYSELLQQGQINPTRSLVDSYVMTDGLPIDKSPLYKKPTKSEDFFNDRDLRLHTTVFKRGDEYNRGTPVFQTASVNFNTTGFVFKKYFNLQDSKNHPNHIIDRFVMRYAEMLLNYAEAVYELGGSINDADLNKSINLLRSRAGIPALTNAFVTSNGLDMLTELRRERRVELAQEGFRYWDLIRWKIAEIELPKTVYGNYLFADEFGKSKPPVTSDNIIIVHDASKRSFRVDRDYLWPFPLGEIALAKGAIDQNPNW